MSSNGKTVAELQSEVAELHRRIAQLEQHLASQQQTEAELRRVQADNARTITDLRTRLQDQAALFQYTIKHTPNAVAIFDTNMCYLMASDRYLNDYGIADQQVLGHNHYDIFPEIPQRWREVHQRSIAGTIETSADDSFVREDGTVTYNRWECRPWYDAQGQIGGMITYTEVLSEYKQIEAQLQLAQMTLDSTADSIHLLEFNGHHRYVNDAACARLGYTREELLAMHIADVDPSLTTAHWEKARERLKQQGTFAMETRHQCKDDTVFPVEVTGTYLSFQGQEYIIAFARDITERKHASEEQQRMITLIENSSDFIGMVALDGSPMFLNAAGRNMVGLESDEEFKRTNMLEFVVPEEREYLLQTILPTVQQQGRWEGELHFRHFKTGAAIPTNYNAFIITDPQTGEPMGYATATRDMTEFKQAEAERAALQAQVIAAQQATLRELSTPLIPLTDTTVVMPLIGSLDSARAQQIIETLLEGVAARRAAVAIMDVTGVPVVDTQVANALLQAAQAVKLLGAQVMITGIRPEIAQTLVGLGIDLNSVRTHASLQTGIAIALASEKHDRQMRHL